MIASRSHYTIRLPRGIELRLGERTLVMGILNITPDSFSDGGLHLDPSRAVDDGLKMIEDGADILDVGGESTRPGAEPVPADEELRRVTPVIERLVAQASVPISIDTYKAVVARAAVACGATIVNDISGLQYDERLGRAIADTGAAAVLMHNRGRSREMYREAAYTDVLGEIVRELEAAIARATAAGVPRQSVIVDPGFGFAKRAEHSIEALAKLERLAALDRPILAGPSRKSFLKEALGDKGPSERDWGSAAAVTACILAGAHIVRVHAVREMAEVVRTADAIRRHGE